MDLYTFLVTLYDQFLSISPPSLQWLITLVVVIGLVAAFINLIRYNWVFLIVLIILLPIVIPVLRHFFADIYNFFLYLLSLLGVKSA